MQAGVEPITGGYVHLLTHRAQKVQKQVYKRSKKCKQMQGWQCHKAFKQGIVMALKKASTQDRNA